MPEIQEPLVGGNASGEVLRIGMTVRKPWLESTPSVQRFMAHLREQGLTVPQPLGKDAQGRQVTEFVPGTPAPHDRPLPLEVLEEVGRLIRRIHDAAESVDRSPDDAWSTLIPVPHANLICHNDLAPWNLVAGEHLAFIDWDGAGPSTRLWDLAYAAQSFAFLVADEDPGRAAARLRALVLDGYRAAADLRAQLPGAMAARTQAMHGFLRESHRGDVQPWGRMFEDGHGQHWARATRFVKEHETLWAQALRA
ncbi:phosphotransferase [Paeniglutamicibacter psychrophenolicus]|uniref:phosphotransferase n=1 Tax=Paeniglutamicibacter psychrophenolicus TaxID=257454 RepID=UPI00277EEC77|nr:phosphotransferase [Paeniglutamicibacter psychrophenolicus]MDQ0092181.1 Ser/Thr protein kinase RdoA (MazF antagonist) [Paeniglutamicibacter psychrophenolicus]